VSIGLLLITATGNSLEETVSAANSLGGITLKVLARAETLTQALCATSEFLPEVSLLDAVSCGIDPPVACQQLLARNPSGKIIVLSVGTDDRKLIRALTSGAAAFLRSQPTGAELQDCIQTIMNNRIYIGPLRVPGVQSPLPQPPRSRDSAALSALSDREIEVLALLADGAKTRDIAEALHISEKTVETHRGHIMQKLGIRSIASLTKFAVKHGLTTLDNK
jgi:two-component system response regulator NreC